MDGTSTVRRTRNVCGGCSEERPPLRSNGRNVFCESIPPGSASFDFFRVAPPSSLMVLEDAPVAPQIVSRPSPRASIKMSIVAFEFPVVDVVAAALDVEVAAIAGRLQAVRAVRVIPSGSPSVLAASTESVSPGCFSNSTGALTDEFRLASRLPGLAPKLGGPPIGPPSPPVMAIIITIAGSCSSLSLAESGIFVAAVTVWLRASIFRFANSISPSSAINGGAMVLNPSNCDRIWPRFCSISAFSFLAPSSVELIVVN